MRVIGFCGPAGAGKSYASEMAATMFPGAVRLPMAAPLKSMLKSLGVPEAALYGTVADKAKPLSQLSGHSARYAMQTLGTEWGRQCMGEDFWVRLWLRSAQSKLTLHNGPILVDDIRFQNEIDAVHKLNGIVIKIVGPTSLTQDHASEAWQVLESDHTFYNEAKSPRALREFLNAVTGRAAVK